MKITISSTPPNWLKTGDVTELTDSELSLMSRRTQMALAELLAEMRYRLDPPSAPLS